MIAGRVEKGHALLPIMFRLPHQPRLVIDFVVDTGFTDALCLPLDATLALGLPYKFDFPARLADGSEVQLPAHEATIVWNGVEQTLYLLATGNRPLVGTALLDGAELRIQFTEGGLVTADSLWPAH